MTWCKRVPNFLVRRPNRTGPNLLTFAFTFLRRPGLDWNGDCGLGISPGQTHNHSKRSEFQAKSLGTTYKASGYSSATRVSLCACHWTRAQQERRAGVSGPFGPDPPAAFSPTPCFGLRNARDCMRRVPWDTWCICDLQCGLNLPPEYVPGSLCVRVAARYDS